MNYLHCELTRQLSKLFIRIDPCAILPHLIQLVAHGVMDMEFPKVIRRWVLRYKMPIRVIARRSSI